MLKILNLGLIWIGLDIKKSKIRLMADFDQNPCKFFSLHYNYILFINKSQEF